MFKIARSGLFRPHGIVSGVPLPDVHGATDPEPPAQFCFSENWSGDLSNGLFQLGDTAAALHGIDRGDCGLLHLVRSYDIADRDHILELFEQAATTTSSFCFSTTILLPSGRKQPVFCVGESNGLEQHYAGSLQGAFFFPRFQLENRGRLFSH